jgi:hypothetical protein
MARLDPEEAKRRARARDAAKKRRKNAKLKAARIAAAIVEPISKTSPLYRRRFAPLPDMTKGELRAMLAEAVRNTSVPA